MLRRLKWWGRIVAWSGGGTLLTMFAFTGVDVHTPWRQIVRIAGQGFVFSTCCIALASIVLPRVVPLARRHFSAPVTWTIVGAALVGSAMAACAGAVLLLAAVRFIEPQRMWQLWLVSLRTATYFTLLFGIIASMMGDLRHRLNRTTEALRTKEREEEGARHAATEAQLASLEARVNPHFLFNTLNSIAALAHSDPSGAERMTTQLASLMRSSLDGGTTSQVTIDEELRLVGHYLEIERVRFGPRLRFSIEIDHEAGPIRLPRLSVQTLVENAVKYAVAPRREGGSVGVRATVSGSHAHIQVEDDGPGFDAAQMSEGYGLALLRSRLELTFGRRARLDIDSRPGRTCVRIEIPIVKC